MKRTIPRASRKDTRVILLIVLFAVLVLLEMTINIFNLPDPIYNPLRAMFKRTTAIPVKIIQDITHTGSNLSVSTVENQTDLKSLENDLDNTDSSYMDEQFKQVGRNFGK
jgi:hypothetical protein